MSIEAWGYSRMSLDRTGEALGIARQEEAIREWAAAHNMNVTRWYHDNDLSASSGVERPDFERLLSERPAGPGIVWHQDRLLRLSRDLERVLDAGFTIHQVTAGSLDLATPTGRMLARTITAFSTFETEHKIERMLLAHAQRRASGKPQWSSRPFGWTRSGRIVDKEAEAIRWGAEAILSGATLSAVMAGWNQRGALVPEIPPNKKHKPPTKGRPAHPWTHITSVRDVLTHERLRGVLLADGREVRGTWQPIIDEGTSHRLRSLLLDPERAHRRAVTAPYSGLMVCGRCGRPLVGNVVKAQQTYVCVGRDLRVAWSTIEDEIRSQVVDAVMEGEVSGLRRPFLPGLDDHTRALLEERREGILGDLDGLAVSLAAHRLTLRQTEVASKALQAELADIERQLAQPHEVRFRTVAEVLEQALTVDSLKRFRIVVSPAGTPKGRVTVTPRA